MRQLEYHPWCDDSNLQEQKVRLRIDVVCRSTQHAYTIYLRTYTYHNNLALERLPINIPTITYSFLLRSRTYLHIPSCYNISQQMYINEYWNILIPWKLAIFLRILEQAIKTLDILQKADKRLLIKNKVNRYVSETCLSTCFHHSRINSRPPGATVDKNYRPSRSHTLHNRSPTQSVTTPNLYTTKVFKLYLGTSIEGERPGFVILMVLPKVCLDFTHYGYYAVVYEMINEYTRYYEPAIRWGSIVFC